MLINDGTLGTGIKELKPGAAATEASWGSTLLIPENMLVVRGFLGRIALANESRLLSNVDWFAEQGLAEYSKTVYDTTTTIQLN